MKGLNLLMEKNKITITINNRDYTLVSADTKEHMEMVAEYIDKKIGEITFASGGSLTIQDTSILAAINVADDYFKSEETADNLRSQIKQYIDEASAASFKNRCCFFIYHKCLLLSHITRPAIRRERGITIIVTKPKINPQRAEIVIYGVLIFLSLIYIFASLSQREATVLK